MKYYCVGLTKKYKLHMRLRNSFLNNYLNKLALKKSFETDKANLANITTPEGEIKVILNKVMYGKAIKQFGKKYTEAHYVEDKMVKLK